MARIEAASQRTYFITSLTQGKFSMQRRDFLKLSAAMAGAATLPASIEAFGAKDPIKVGVLHSLSGTMAISETALKNTALMTFEEINASGGVLGRPIEPVVVDPASNWPLFAEKARQLITQDKVAAVFGCWTSVSRKSVLPNFLMSETMLCQSECPNGV